jgi:hypothetical protein
MQTSQHNSHVLLYAHVDSIIQTLSLHLSPPSPSTHTHLHHLHPTYPHPHVHIPSPPPHSSTQHKPQTNFLPNGRLDASSLRIQTTFLPPSYRPVSSPLTSPRSHRAPNHHPCRYRKRYGTNGQTGITAWFGLRFWGSLGKGRFFVLAKGCVMGV